MIPLNSLPFIPFRPPGKTWPPGYAQRISRAVLVRQVPDHPPLWWRGKPDSGWGSQDALLLSQIRPVRGVDDLKFVISRQTGLAQRAQIHLRSR